jgi:hypothetical protein
MEGGQDLPASFPARHLDEKGRCCGRKPLVYKRPEHYLFCVRCNARFTPTGVQEPNWAWLWAAGAYAPQYPDQDYVQMAADALANTPAKGSV